MEYRTGTSAGCLIIETTELDDSNEGLVLRVLYEGEVCAAFQYVRTGTHDNGSDGFAWWRIDA